MQTLWYPLILFTKHDAIEIADPSHMKESYELHNGSCSPLSLRGSVVEHRSAESEGPRFDIPHGDSEFSFLYGSLCYTAVKSLQGNFPCFSAGYYMLLEASGQSRGDKARIMRTYNKATFAESCFQFWYMMYGSSLGTLNVYQKVGNSLGNTIWTVTGDQGVQRTWLKGRVTLNSTAQFTVSLVIIAFNSSGKFRLNRRLLVVLSGH